MEFNEQIKQVIANAVKVTPYNSTTALQTAYEQGAWMMYDFLLHNPSFLDQQDAIEFRSLIFPSQINHQEETE